MKWLWIVLGAIVVVVALATIVGWLLPKRHVASVRARYGQTPERIFELIADPRHGPEWRSDLDSVEVLSTPGAPLRWREISRSGVVVFRQELVQPPSRLVGRIDDPELPFGGRWIYDLRADGATTLLTLTEEGEVYNPLFRFMSRFVFGHYRSMERYLRDLARHFGQNVTMERVG